MRSTTFNKVFLKELITNIPHYVFWKDINSVYLGCNQNFAVAVGLKEPSDIINRTDYELPWKEHADVYREEDLQIISSGKPIHDRELTLVNQKGELRNISVSKVPLHSDHGKLIGILGIYTDITHRKQQERALLEAKDRAEAASRAKSIFLSEHESRYQNTHSRHYKHR